MSIAISKAINNAIIIHVDKYTTIHIYTLYMIQARYILIIAKEDTTFSRQTAITYQIRHCKMHTYNVSGTVYAALRVANQPGGYIAHGRNVQEAINNLFIVYNRYN